MLAKTWVKWLSVIALLVIGGFFLMKFVAFFSGEVASASYAEITVLLLAIAAVINSFTKKK